MFPGECHVLAAKPSRLPGFSSCAKVLVLPQCLCPNLLHLVLGEDSLSFQQQPLWRFSGMNQHPASSEKNPKGFQNGKEKEELCFKC